MGLLSSLFNSLTESGAERAYRIYHSYSGQIEGILREYQRIYPNQRLSEEYKDRYKRQIRDVLSAIRFIAINGSPRDAEQATTLYKHLLYRYEDVFDEIGIQKLTI